MFASPSTKLSYVCLRLLLSKVKMNYAFFRSNFIHDFRGNLPQLTHDKAMYRVGV